MAQLLAELVEHVAQLGAYRRKAVAEPLQAPAHDLHQLLQRVQIRRLLRGRVEFNLGFWVSALGFKMKGRKG